MFRQTINAQKSMKQNVNFKRIIIERVERIRQYTKRAQMAPHISICQTVSLNDL